MNAEFIFVGTEILLGNILNTNAQFLSEQCAAIGISCYYQTVVGDNKERLRDAFLAAWNRTDCVFLSGGLGPTEDDLTMNRFLRETGIPFSVVATKADKISRGARSKYLAPICRALSVQPWEIICFSGEDGTGRDDLLKLLDGILHPAEA